MLAHNDLLAGNILIDEASGAVRFIDYEYGAPGTAAYDVANHFCEYAGFDADLARGFPRRDARLAFIAAYLGEGATPRDVADFGAVTDGFVEASHLFWGAWAVVQPHRVRLPRLCVTAIISLQA